MRRFFFALLMFMFAADSVHAQIIRRPRAYTTNDPDWWVSAGVGGFRGNGVNDGVTASNWDFGNATNIQYRASLEKAMDNGASFGIAGSYSRVPFTYSSNLSTPLAAGENGTRCASCNAHLDMTTLVVGFHSGSGIGFHQVVELNGGVAMYRNLKEDAGGASLAPSKGNIDPLFSLAYGFGYGISNRMNLDFIFADYTFAIHERKGLANGTSNTNSMPSLRVALRMGFGSHTITR
ncbi:MAG: hypothetical protein QOD47_2692 [Gemmatimonadaceae bacterium]|nr:hypothetical protein [Gemmatimonadaceae bacterium]